MRQFLSTSILIILPVLLIAQWNYRNGETNDKLNSVFFIDESNGWAVGDNNTIVHSTNGGNGWDKVDGPNTNFVLNFNNVCFTDLMTGMIDGMAIGPMELGETKVTLTSDDGGEDWSCLDGYNFDNTNYGGWRDACFYDNNTGWKIYKKGEIYKTTSGISGEWEMKKSFENELFAMDFFDQSHGWVVGNDGFVARTLDGGENWTSFATGIEANLRSVSFGSANVGYAVGTENGQGVVYKSSNGGQSWIQLTIPETTKLNCVKFVSENRGWAGGALYSVGKGSKGAIIVTFDGGTTWESQGTIENDQIVSLYFLNQNRGWAVGGWGDVYVTVNGGAGIGDYPNGSYVNLELKCSPNPFDNNAIISYRLNNKSDIRLEVFNSNGQIVNTSYKENQQIGPHELELDASNFIPGIYYARINSNEGIQVIKLVKVQ